MNVALLSAHILRAREARCWWKLVAEVHLAPIYSECCAMVRYRRLRFLGGRLAFQRGFSSTSNRRGNFFCWCDPCHMLECIETFCSSVFYRVHVTNL